MLHVASMAKHKGGFSATPQCNFVVIFLGLVVIRRRAPPAHSLQHINERKAHGLARRLEDNQPPAKIKNRSPPR
jgi:hypothetical protein